MSTTTPLGTTDLTAQAPAAAVTASPKPTSLLRRVVQRPMGAVSLAVFLGIIIACAAAPLIAPHGPYASSLTAEMSGPSGHHLLGTDELGRDILSRLLYGGRPTLLAAAMSTAIAILLGTVLGVVSGYRRGLTDRVVSLWSDLLLTMPVLVVLIVVVSVYPTSLYPAMIPLGVMLSAAPTRMLRSVTLSVREDLYIEAARVNGLSHGQIMVRHVLPRIRGAIVVQATLVGAVSVLMASGLAFLGFGVQVPAPSWGTMVQEAASQYQQDAWFLVPTGGVIALTILSLGLLGDVLRDAVAEQWTGVRVTRRRARRTARAAMPAEVAAAMPAAPDAVLGVRDLMVTAPRPGGGELVLVQGMSFDVRAGRTLAIVGESGCGKSVTARALLGIAPPGGRIAGSVRFDGGELVGAPTARLREVRGRRIAFIGQDPLTGLDPTQPVGAALAEVVRAYSGCGRRAARETALELLGRVRLDDPVRVARLYPHQISGGMAQRVTIARALAGDPEIIVADEPTTALDVTVQADILALLVSLQLSSKIAILLITHDWGVVAGMADEVLVMYAGQVVEHGPAGRLFEHPQHPYSDLLLRSNPHRAPSGSRLPAIAGTVPGPGQWPESCRFADRCPLATDACTAAPIPLLTVGEEQQSRCIRVDALEAVR
ncbi:MAG: dipeptide/oligopeptide/nickel ABC transporter permease/ATP-binding protein [Solirubrobacteraceae bacterium]